VTSIIADERAQFRSLDGASAMDWQIIERAEARHRANGGPADGLLRLLASIEHMKSVGYPVNVYSHSLQTATRVLEAGRDDELVVVALFHDVPQAFSDNDHGWLAAQMLSPWISARRAWMLTHHGAFQSAHFANHPTRNVRDREKHIGHEAYAETSEFCAVYDQTSFDPDFTSLPLKVFEPIVQRFFATAATAK